MSAIRKVLRCLLLMLVPVVLAGCAVAPSPDQRTQQAQKLAIAAGMQPFTSHTALPLHGYARLQQPGGRLVVYIEGDGHAWIDAHTPSPDPTPLNPVALQLAAIDTSPDVFYLARPGQYGVGNTDRRYWLSARFSAEVVAASHDAIVELAGPADKSAIDLVGYSGGAAIAALVAARLRAEGYRDLTLRTIAGNLDTAAWTRLRRLDPLTDSLDPADVAVQLQDVPQRHLVGRRDRQVPSAVLDAFLSRMTRRDCVAVMTVDADHAGPWREAWQQQLASPPACGQLH